jgi:hypothetical protein
MVSDFSVDCSFRFEENKKILPQRRKMLIVSMARDRRDFMVV